MSSFSNLALIAIVSSITWNFAHAFSFATEDFVKFPDQHVVVSNNNNKNHNKNRFHYLTGRRQASSTTTTTTTLMAEKRNNGNPFQNLIGGMTSSILQNVGGSDISVVNQELDNKLEEIASLPSWDEIRTKLESKQTDEEKAFRSIVEKGIGRASPLNKVRLFDESNKEEDIRVTLYRDSASWCPCKCLHLFNCINCTFFF